MGASGGAEAVALPGYCDSFCFVDLAAQNIELGGALVDTLVLVSQLPA
jgi:hypothetical protein